MTRIPREKIDRLYKASTSNPAARCITLLVRNHIFSVDVCNEKGTFIGLSAMTERLQACVAAALSSKPAIPLPVLTADGRDAWAKVCGSLKNGYLRCSTNLESRAPRQPVPHQPDEPFGNRCFPVLSVIRCDNKQHPASVC
jgi:Choline/Carnitine o-acyltransferase